MNLRQMAEAAGFWGWTVWPEELRDFARLAIKDAIASGDVYNYMTFMASDTSLTDEPPKEP